MNNLPPPRPRHQRTLSPESSDSAGGAAEFHDGSNAIAKGSSGLEGEPVFDETDGSLKQHRDQESELDSDFITPNRTAKSRPLAGSGPAPSILLCQSVTFCPRSRI